MYLIIAVGQREFLLKQSSLSPKVRLAPACMAVSLYLPCAAFARLNRTDLHTDTEGRTAKEGGRQCFEFQQLRCISTVNTHSIPAPLAGAEVNQFLVLNPLHRSLRIVPSQHSANDIEER